MYIATTLKVGDRLLRGNVRMPDGEGKFPTIIFLHGFTVWKTGPQRLYEEFVQRAEKEGFCIVRFDFYGTGESDGEFWEMTLGSEMTETDAIFEWTKQQPYVDTDKIYIGGHSMGGLLAVTEAPKLQPAGIFGWAPAMSMVYQAGKRTRTLGGPSEHGWDIDGLELSREYMEEAYGMDFIAMGKGYDGPVLLIHGTGDMDIPMDDSMILTHAVYGDNCELKLIEGANHRFLRVDWKKQVYDMTLEFLKKLAGMN